MFALSGQKKSLLLLLLLFLDVLATPAFAVELLGNWSYLQSGGDNRETQSTFQQRYQLGVGPAVTIQLTPAITVSGGVGYRNTQRDSGNGREETVEQVSPFGSLSLMNDIFIVDLSANSFTTMAGSDNSSSYWSTSVKSAWDAPLWPNLSFNYAEDYAGVNQATLFDDSNGKTQNTTINVDWDLLLANLYYEYNLNELVSGDGDSQSETTSHFGRLQSEGNFWNRRIGLSLAQQYREVSTDVSVGEADEDAGENFFRDQVGGQTLSLVTGGAANIDEAQLSINNLLNDGIFNVTAEVVPATNIGYFGFRTGASEQIDTLYLSLDPSMSPLNSGQAAALQWDLYVKKAIPVGLSQWDLVGSIPADFNFDEQRFEFVVDINESEIMVVTTNQAGTQLFFSELEAFRFITQSGASKTTSYKTTVGTRLNITKSLNATFSFDYEHAESDDSNSTVSENDKTSLSGRLSWAPLPYVTTSLGYSDFLEERTGRPDDLNRLYSATVSTNPLPSVNVSLGYTHNDRYADDAKIFTSDAYSLYSKFAIYPDLTTSLSTSYAISDVLIEDADSDDEASFVNNKSFSARADLSARLYRNLTAYVASNYNNNDNELNGKSETGNATFTLNCRPSDILNLQASYNTFFLEDERSDGLSANMELYLLRTYKSRLSFYASHTQSDNTVDSFSVVGSWDISDYLTLTTNGTYSMGLANIYSFYVNLSMRL
jgi:hypothetical protein